LTLRLRVSLSEKPHLNMMCYNWLQALVCLAGRLALCSDGVSGEPW